MYTWFYGFSEEPFNVHTDPKFLFLSPTHQEALEALMKGIRERRKFTLILGELGAGKTTLIHHLLGVLGSGIKKIPVFHPPETFEELLGDILRELGIPPLARNKVSMIRQLHDFLQSLAQEETLVVILDEVQQLNGEILEELYLLSDREAGTSPKLLFLLLGQPEFQSQMDSEGWKELKRRADIIRQIRPLTEEECCQYINHRLKKVGSEIGKVLTPEALFLICQYGKGNPRSINILCDNAFLIGYGLSQKKINVSILTEVLEDLDYLGEEEESEEPTQGRRKSRSSREKGEGRLWRKLSYGLLALAGIGAVIFWGRAYWKEPGEKLIPKFPILPPASVEKMGPPATEAKPGRMAKVVPKGEAEQKTASSPPQLERGAPPAAPARTIGKEPSAPSSGGQTKSPPSVSAPGPKKVVTKPIPPAPIPRPPTPKARTEPSVQKVVSIQPGDSIYTIAEKNYKVANTSIVDHILELNPRIANPNKLLAKQEIRLPALTEESLLVESPDGTYRVRLGTFLKAEYATFLKAQPVLKGKEMEILPRKLPTGETWYRVVAGKFPTREEGLRVIDTLKKQGLSPYFPGFRRSKG